MAEIEKGILGGFSGKVGTVVGSNWRGKNIIRSLPKKSKRIASDLQLLQREKFRLVAQFLAPLSRLTGKYFGQYQGAKSRSNLAMSHQLMEAVVETDGVLSLDFSKVLLTKGTVPIVQIESSIIENNALTIAWTSNADFGLAKATDRLIVVVYSKAHKLFYVIESEATRADETLTAPLPTDWGTADNEVWVCWVSENALSCSTSMYLGAL